MPISHVLLAFLVVIIWGVNFIFVRLSLDEISPILLCALRFFLASIPAIFFIKPPKVSAKIIIAYGLIMFALQFGLFFMAMKVGMPPGMASVIIQVQVFFSMFFAVLFLDERPAPSQVIGALVSFSGLGIVALHVDQTISLLGFFLLIAAAASWGVGNLFTKKTGEAKLISVLAWSSFVAFWPMLILSILVEGPTNLIHLYSHVSKTAIFSVCYIVYVSTWIGYGAWNWLMARYPVAVIAPFILMVPLVGMISSILIFDESLESWKVVAGLFILSGLIINLLGTRVTQWKLRLLPKETSA